MRLVSMDEKIAAMEASMGALLQQVSNTQQFRMTPTASAPPDRPAGTMPPPAMPNQNMERPETRITNLLDEDLMKSPFEVDRDISPERFTDGTAAAQAAPPTQIPESFMPGAWRNDQQESLGQPNPFQTPPARPAFDSPPPVNVN